MQLSEIISYITDRYTPVLATTKVTKHINEIYLDITRPFTLDITKEATINTVAKQKTVDFTMSARNVKYILGLRRIDKRAIVYPQGEGKPKRWDMLESNAKAILDPIPDAVYTHTVQYEPLPLVLALDADEPLYIPSEYHHLIAWGTMAIVASIDEDDETAAMWEARYRDGVNQMVLHLGLTAPENYPSLAVVKDA